MRTAILAGLAALTPAQALAGAWAQEAGRAQVIAKLEIVRADQGFDLDGGLADLPARREDGALSLFAEHGLTETLTLQIRTEWQRGRDAFVDYEGAGPTEIGVRWQAWRDEDGAVSLYAGYALAGEGRNAGYAAPGAGDGDWEVRALVGRRLPQGWLGGRDGFVEVQAARRFRSGLPDEHRLDVTVGIVPAPDWTVLSQIYAGQSLDSGQARWVNGEVSVVRRLGDWSLQAGWRQALAGREAPAQSGVILAVWRRF